MGDTITAVELRIEKKGIEKGLVPSVKTMADSWTSLTLGSSMAESVLRTLVDTEQLSGAQKLNWTERASGYIRFYRQNASEGENNVFAHSFYELTSPFQCPRYIVPFFVNHVTRQPMAKWMPNVIGRMFDIKEPTLIRYHAVPAALSRKKEIVDIFQNHWNESVSTDDAVYTQQGIGQKTRDAVRSENRMPKTMPHLRDCFM